MRKKVLNMHGQIQSKSQIGYQFGHPKTGAPEKVHYIFVFQLLLKLCVVNSKGKINEIFFLSTRLLDYTRKVLGKSFPMVPGCQKLKIFSHCQPWQRLMEILKKTHRPNKFWIQLWYSSGFRWVSLASAVWELQDDKNGSLEG